MTYGELKQRIYSLLNIDGKEEDTVGSLANLVNEALVQTVNAVSRKVAICRKALYKTEELYFTKDAIGIRASLPEDVATVKEIYKGKRRYGSISFEKVGNHLIFFGAKEGFYMVGYYAFPNPLDEDILTEDFVLELNDHLCDAVAYGVCAELCMKVYPGDMKRYMRLATEFDLRMTGDFILGDRRMEDTVFSKKRGFS